MGIVFYASSIFQTAGINKGSFGHSYANLLEWIRNILSVIKCITGASVSFGTTAFAIIQVIETLRSTTVFIQILICITFM